MKVLFLSQPFPYPPNTGSRNLIFHWLEAASQAHDVHLLWIGDRSEGSDHIPELPGVSIGCAQVLPTKEISARIRRLATAAVWGIPPTSLVGMNRATRSEILRQVRRGGYDVVVLTENVVAGYASRLAPLVPVVLFKHSVQAVDARDARISFGMWHPRWILEEWMVRRFEARSCNAATVVCAVNSEDVVDLKRRYPVAKTAKVVPIGVDLSKFPRRERDPGGLVAGFFGNITWGANLDAARWFIKKILPKVWQTFPSAQFRIIGPGSEDVVPGKRDPRIVCQGSSHIPSAMKDVTVGVVPVISGTGVRLKLLEMLSLGIPIVTTELGALGTGCVNGEHALISDDADSFAAAIIGLFGDAELRQKLVRAGWKLIQMHSWETFYPRILDVIEDAASTRRSYTVTRGESDAQEAL